MRVILAILVVLTFLTSACEEEYFKESAVTLENNTTTSAEMESLSIEATVGAAEIAYEFDALFTRYGNGWTGGDGTISIELPDKRTVWLFGDSFLDTVFQDRSRPVTSMVNNTLVVQDGENLTTLYGGTKTTPKAFFTPKNDNEWYWPYDGTVKGDKLLVFLSAFKRTGSGMWDFGFVRTDIAVVSLPDFKIQTIRPFSTNLQFNFGACILEEKDYIYIYGVEDAGINKYAHVARIKGSNIKSLEFYTGQGWSKNMNDSFRLAMSSGKTIDVSNQFSVLSRNDRYYLITQEILFGKKIFAYSATSPIGPWDNKEILYETPEPNSGNNLYTYNTQAHPQFEHPDGKLLLSYNINSFNFLDLYKNADNYRPRFIWTILGEE